MRLRDQLAIVATKFTDIVVTIGMAALNVKQSELIMELS